MAPKTLAGTAVSILRTEADLILQHGWNGNPPLRPGKHAAAGGLNLTQSALWAVAGRPCSLEELSPLESTRYRDYLDLLEHALRMPAERYEEKHADASTMAVVWVLEETAWNLECTLLEALND